MAERVALPGDFANDAITFARKAWRALARGTGMHLTEAEVVAVHLIMADGEWWQQFNPANRSEEGAHHG
jgi:hypothetical protein